MIEGACSLGVKGLQSLQSVHVKLRGGKLTPVVWGNGHITHQFDMKEGGFSSILKANDAL